MSYLLQVTNAATHNDKKNNATAAEMSDMYL